MKGRVHREAYFTLLLLLIMSCNRRHDEAPKMQTAESAASGQSRTESASTRPAIALQEVVFIGGDDVLTFPGYLQGLAQESVANQDRLPLVTRDGGASWSKLRDETLNFESIHFAGLSQGWLVNIDSELWKTGDGGASWQFVSKIEDGDQTLIISQQIVFTGELTGWILDLDALWHTEDGGRTWSRRDFPQLSTRFFLHGEFIWVASRSSSEENNFIYKTRDAGRSWQEIEVLHTRLADNADDEMIDDICFADSQRGWFVKPHRIYRTVDGGQSWQLQRLPGKGISLKSLCFINEREGWAAGRQFRPGEPEWDDDPSDAILLHTTNAGETWKSVDIGARQTKFDRVYFGDSQNGWLVSQEVAGEFTNANLYRTRDGGTNWQNVLSVKSPYDFD